MDVVHPVSTVNDCGLADRVILSGDAGKRRISALSISRVRQQILNIEMKKITPKLEYSSQPVLFLLSIQFNLMYASLILSSSCSGCTQTKEEGFIDRCNRFL